MSGIRRISEAVLLSLSCLGGAIVAIPAPFIGLPLSAAALAGLIYRGRSTVAITVAVFCVVVMGLIMPPNAVMVALALGSTFLAIGALRSYHVYTVALIYVPAVALALASRDIAVAWLSGLTVAEHFQTSLDAVGEMLSTFGPQDALEAEAVNQMLELLPAVYLLTAAASVIPTLLVVRWVASRSKTELAETPRIDLLDLSPHVLWPLVIAVAVGAAGQLWPDTGAPLETVAINLLFAVRMVLFIQGLAVIAALVRHLGATKLSKVLAVVLAVLAEGPLLLVSIVGFLDFWFNFRKLNREVAGGSDATPANK
ncbi:MAG: YybS family protein [Actinobacteria bacterium]|nr:YybS family protein [Actinomycetota bacterium]